MRIPRRSRLSVQWEWQKYTRPSPLLSKDEELKDIGHSMSIGNLILDANSVAVSYLIRYGSLLQNATDIIAKCDSYYKLWQIYYKMRQLLHNATNSLQNATVHKLISKYCKSKFWFDLTNYKVFLEKMN